MLEWQAFYVMEASDENPEITEWDDEHTARAKQKRAAQLADARRR